MTKLTFVVTALIAAAACTTQASAAVRHAAPRHTHAANAVGNCVRAPNVGSFASVPYTEPPCMPGTAR